VSDDEVAAMRTEGGAAGFAAIAAELIRATFGAQEESLEDGTEAAARAAANPPEAKAERRSTGAG
jgi:hypothetical protein